MSPDNFSLLRVLWIITIPLWAQKGISQRRDCGSISATWPTLFFCKRLHQQIWIYGLKDVFQTNPQPHRMQAIEPYPSLLLVSLQILSSWNKIHLYGGKLQILFTYLHILQSVKQEQKLVTRCFLKKSNQIFDFIVNLLVNKKEEEEEGKKQMGSHDLCKSVYQTDEPINLQTRSISYWITNWKTVRDGSSYGTPSSYLIYNEVAYSKKNVFLNPSILVLTNWPFHQHPKPLTLNREANLNWLNSW